MKRGKAFCCTYHWLRSCNKQMIVTIGPQMMTWITTFLFSALIHPAPSCHDAFVPLAPIQSSQLEMGQDSVGVDWSNFKNRKEIETAFSERQQTQPEITPQEFVLELTTVKPLKIYYATNGRPYLADGYHKFRGQTTFIGTRKPFVVNTRTLRDYRETNPTTGRPWTLRAMERDLQKNNWIQLRGVDKPTMSDLEQLPDSVLELADSPQRSTIGFLFRSFATPLR